MRLPYVCCTWQRSQRADIIASCFAVVCKWLAGLLSDSYRLSEAGRLGLTPFLQILQALAMRGGVGASCACFMVKTFMLKRDSTLHQLQMGIFGLLWWEAIILSKVNCFTFLSGQLEILPVRFKDVLLGVHGHLSTLMNAFSGCLVVSDSLFRTPAFMPPGGQCQELQGILKDPALQVMRHCKQASNCGLHPQARTFRTSVTQHHQVEYSPWDVALHHISRMRMLLSVAADDDKAWAPCLTNLDSFTRQLTVLRAGCV
eukprot:1158564-Pelagomonas_calceolata.AAC.3